MTEASSRRVGVPAWSTSHWLGTRQTREFLVAWDYQGEDIGEGRRRVQWRDFFFRVHFIIFMHVTLLKKEMSTS